jgi:hypothetical protein
MAAVIRLYRRFYKINSSGSGDIYNLIDPVNLSASSFLKDTSSLVESVSSVQRESLGVYFVDLDPNLYSYSNTYDLKWTVKYLDNVGNKNLLTTFKLKPISISGEVEANLDSATEFNYEINETDTIEITIDEETGYELEDSMETDIPEIIEVEILKEM